MKIPKKEKARVLVAAPTSKRHSHLLDDWVKNVSKFTPKCDMMLVDNTLDNGVYFRKIKTKYKNIKIVRHNWKQAKRLGDLKKFNLGYRHSLQMLADCRNEIRTYFLKGKYTHLFNLDVDVFPNQNYLSWLIAYDKDQVGPIIHFFGRHKTHQPATSFAEINLIDKKNPMHFYTFKELNCYRKMAKAWFCSKKQHVGFKPDDVRVPFLQKVYATSFGCLLIKRKVIEAVPFRTSPIFILGEDEWFYKETYDKGFESWVDTSYRVPHKHNDSKPVGTHDFKLGELRLEIQRIHEPIIKKAKHGRN